MNGPFVVDSSVALTWLFRDEATARTNALLGLLATTRAVVPAWWFIELTNVIALAERRNRISPAQSTAFIADISKLDIEVDSEAPNVAFAELLPLCRTHHLTSYDAVYLELAIRKQLPLATLDEDLRKAAKKAGLKLMPV
jgi:predicted nucleic acid-binding protein